MEEKKIVLAYSGGLDTSAIIPWLRDNYDAGVIAYCSDLGNSPDEGWLGRRARELGACEFIFEDLRDELVGGYVFPAVRAGAVYQDDYLLGTALGRPLIAERVAAIARERGAFAIAHGATGKGNDQIRFERAWAYLVPDIRVIAPWKIWDFEGRADLVAYLESKGFDANARQSRFSVDVNLLHRSCEGDVLEDPEMEYDPEDVYEWTAPHHLATGAATDLSVEFERGIPVGMDGKRLSPAALLSELNETGGRHGIGVADLVEERTNGIKSRGIYETPGGTILHKACRILKHLCWDRTTLGIASRLGCEYADIVYDGMWHSDARASIDAFFEKASEVLTGSVRMRLKNGHAMITGRSSPFSLYGKELVSFEKDPCGLNKASAGFCRTLCFRQEQCGRRNNVRSMRSGSGWESSVKAAT
jgi:argininosuccinate synthase